jgi:antitoxin component of MazEF toxin-antitoxin module
MISPGASRVTTQIVREGDTLAVEIPEELVEQASLTVGEPLEWVIDGPGRLTLRRQSKPEDRKSPADMTLEELLEGLPEDAEMEEIDWGPDRGAEVW